MSLFPSLSGCNPRNFISFTCHVAFISFNLDVFLSSPCPSPSWQLYKYKPFLRSLPANPNQAMERGRTEKEECFISFLRLLFFFLLGYLFFLTFPQFAQIDNSEISQSHQFCETLTYLLPSTSKRSLLWLLCALT